MPRLQKKLRSRRDGVTKEHLRMLHTGHHFATGDVEGMDDESVLKLLRESSLPAAQLQAGSPLLGRRVQRLHGVPRQRGRVRCSTSSTTEALGALPRPYPPTRAARVARRM